MWIFREPVRVHRLAELLSPIAYKTPRMKSSKRSMASKFIKSLARHFSACLFTALISLSILAIIELFDLFAVEHRISLDTHGLALFLYSFFAFYCLSAIVIALLEGISVFTVCSLTGRIQPVSKRLRFKALLYTLCSIPFILYFSRRIFTGMGISSKLELLAIRYSLPFDLPEVLSSLIFALLTAVSFATIRIVLRRNEVLSARRTRIWPPPSSILLLVLIIALYIADSRLFARLYEYIHFLLALLLILLGQLLVIRMGIPAGFSGARSPRALRIWIIPLAVMAAVIVFLPYTVSKNMMVKQVLLENTTICRKLASRLDALIQAAGGGGAQAISLLGSPGDRILADLNVIIAREKPAYPLARRPSRNHLLPIPGDFNVLYIVIDALRPDHLGCYGYSRVTSPNIDSVAARGVVFLRNYSQGNHTLTSMCSLLTSRYPYTLRRTPDLDPGFKPRYFLTGAPPSPDADAAYAMLASVLREHGIRSYALYPISEDKLRLSSFFPFNKILFSFGRLMPPTAESIAAILDDNRHEADKRFFVYVHLHGTHYPYKTHAGFDFGPDLRDRYDSEVRYSDVELGRIVRMFKDKGFEDKTVLIINADHGSELRDHGGLAHGSTLYDEQIHVPLIIRIPGVAPSRVKTPTANIDILPTILDILDIPSPLPLQGRSLVPLIRGEGRGAASVFSETSNKKMIRRGCWKYIFGFDHGSEELYNLSTDPHERMNLIAAKHERARKLKRELALHTLAEYELNPDNRLLEKLVALDNASVMNTIGGLLRSGSRPDRIRALGFISGSGDPRFLGAVVTLAGSDNREELLGAIKYLGKCRARASIRTLERLALSSDMVVRKQALRALASFDDPRLTRRIVRAHRDNEADLRVIRSAEYAARARDLLKAGNLDRAKQYCAKSLELDHKNPLVEKVVDCFDDARFISQEIPRIMRAGETYTITITMKNTGLSTWNIEKGYFLGSLLPDKNLDWEGNRKYLGAGEEVKPGETATFVMSDRAPLEPGKYRFQRMMGREPAKAFGEKTPLTFVTVIASSRSSGGGRTMR